VEFLWHRIQIHLVHAAKGQHRLVKRKNFVKWQVAVAHGLSQRQRKRRDFFPEGGKLAVEKDFTMGIPRLGVLERKTAQHVDEGLCVAAEAVGLAGEAIKTDEGLLVGSRGYGFLDLVSLLETSGKIKGEGDSEEFLGREDALLLEEDIRRDRGANETPEAVENKDRRRVDFGRGGLGEQALNDRFGLFLKADIQEGEGFLDAGGNFVLAHDFSEKLLV